KVQENKKLYQNVFWEFYFIFIGKQVLYEYGRGKFEAMNFSFLFLLCFSKSIGAENLFSDKFVERRRILS
ncbi:hypothetical protein DF186_22805, partial [Enterococcus hirae]